MPVGPPSSPAISAGSNKYRDNQADKANAHDNTRGYPNCPELGRLVLLLGLIAGCFVDRGPWGGDGAGKGVRRHDDESQSLSVDREKKGSRDALRIWCKRQCLST